ncbi:hypothetical protein TNCV_4093371 [Trichonephila clavipes]|nr:hypothetical protein TNCV_4093371 [Trichonephila clavipes]
MQIDYVRFPRYHKMDGYIYHDAAGRIGNRLKGRRCAPCESIFVVGCTNVAMYFYAAMSRPCQQSMLLLTPSHCP